MPVTLSLLLCCNNIRDCLIEKYIALVITAGRASFSYFKNDVKILFSKWPISSRNKKAEQYSPTN